MKIKHKTHSKTFAIIVGDRQYLQLITKDRQNKMQLYIAKTKLRQ